MNNESIPFRSKLEMINIIMNTAAISRPIIIGKYDGMPFSALERHLSLSILFGNRPSST